MTQEDGTVVRHAALDNAELRARQRYADLAVNPAVRDTFRKRATIIKPDGDKMPAQNLADAAKTMTSTPGGMQLRVLQTLDGLGPTPSNTIIIPIPLELLDGFKEIAAALRDSRQGKASPKAKAKRK